MQRIIEVLKNLFAIIARRLAREIVNGVIAGIVGGLAEAIADLFRGEPEKAGA